VGARAERAVGLEGNVALLAGFEQGLPVRKRVNSNWFTTGGTLAAAIT